MVQCLLYVKLIFVYIISKKFRKQLWARFLNRCTRKVLFYILFLVPRNMFDHYSVFLYYNNNVGFSLICIYYIFLKLRSKENVQT